MRLILIFTIFFSLISSYAQDFNLFQHNWRLEKIVTSNETFIPDTNNSPPGTPFDYLYFYDISENVPFDLQFGAFGSLMAHDIVYDNINQSFDISFLVFLQQVRLVQHPFL